MGGSRFINESNNLMSQRTDTPGAGLTRRLYREFEQFYSAERCAWAPANPRRVFNLAFETVYPRFKHRLSEEEFAAVIYSTLGFRGSKPLGLFETFDPGRYTRLRHLDDHFLSMFARKLTGKVKRVLSRTTDRGRPGDETRFKANPALGLLHERVRPASEQARHDILPAVLACLDARERAVIHLMYWADLSARKVGVMLGMDHKTVAKVHEVAVTKLRRLYGVGENRAA